MVRAGNICGVWREEYDRGAALPEKIFSLWFPKAKPKTKTRKNGNHFFTAKEIPPQKNRNVTDIWHTICGSDVIRPIPDFFEK